MEALGEAMGRACVGGEVFLLTGNLGAGKTQWTKGLGRGIGVTSVINSPTFTIVKPHEGRLTLQHIDLYRLGSEGECEELALEDLIGPDTVVAIEWAERFPRLGESGKPHRLVIDFGETDQDRIVTLMTDNKDLARPTVGQAGVVPL